MRYEAYLVVVLVIVAVHPAYADTINQLYKSGVPLEEIMCRNADHHIAVRDNGEAICATGQTLDRMGLVGIESAEHVVPVVLQQPQEVRLVEGPTICGKAMADVTDVEPDVGIPADVANASNDFAIDFYRLVSNETDNQGKNVFISPLSIYTAFAMLYETALEDSAAQLEDVFGFESNMKARHEIMSQAVAASNRDDQDATLDMANALWVAKNIPVYESLPDILNNVYSADAEELDFLYDRNASAARLNEWASDNTNGNIPEITTPDKLDPNTRIVLTNAVYFNATWLIQFDESDTQSGDFWINQDETSTAEYMHMTDLFNYTSADGVSVLQLPYLGDRFSMLVILPDDIDGIGSLTQNLSAAKIEEWTDSMTGENVEIKIPKFTTKGSYDLIPTLKEMGVTDIFDQVDSDLSCVSPEAMALANPSLLPNSLKTTVFESLPLHVYKAAHDTAVEVNESGTVAAAVTALYGKLAGGPADIKSFEADHPFLYLILDDESGTILFMGRVMNPAS